MSDFANDITGKLEDAAEAMIQASLIASIDDGAYPTIVLCADSTIADIEDQDEKKEQARAVARSIVHSGVSPDDIALPRIVCISPSADVLEWPLGNWEADLRVEVSASAVDTSRDAFRLMCGESWKPFFLAPDTVCSALSNADIKFTAFFVEPKSQQKNLVAGESTAEWNGVLVVSVRCCGSVVA